MTIFEKKVRKRITNLEGENASKARKYETKILEYLQVEENDSEAAEKDLEDMYQKFVSRGEDIVLINLKSGLRKEYKNGKETTSQLILITSIEEDLQKAINHLYSGEARNKGVDFKGGQDFALIKLAIRKGLVNGYDRIMSKSDSYFIELMTSLGFGGQICKRPTLYKFSQTANTKFWPWRYLDSYENRAQGRDCDPAERKRRNRIVYEFVEYMAHLRGANEAMNKFMNTSF